MKNVILNRKTDRFSLLYTLYRKSNGLNGQACDLRVLASHEGVGIRAFRAAFNFLLNERLIQTHTGFSESDMYHASITAKGIEAIESVFQDESIETSYFPPFQQMMM